MPATRGEVRRLRARERLQLVGRALRLRCPNCGGGPVLERWLRLRARCPRCNLPLDRGEADYFLGAVMFNLLAAELAFALVLALFLALTWPHVPWGAVQVASGALMVAAPFALYPVTKLLWLAFDLAFRPLRFEELEDGGGPRPA